MKHRYLALVVGSVWSISACGARTNEEEFLGYYGGVKPGSGGAPGSGGEAPGGAGGLGPGGGGSGGANVGGSGGFVNTGGRPGVGGNPSGGAGGSGGSPPINSCCEPHGEMGCNVPFVEECTCNLDSYCCEKMWDDRCVQVADRACLASCGAGSGGQGATGGQGGVGGLTSTGGASDPGNCCSAHDSPGCQNTDIQDCVCGGDTFDTFCCNTAWDDICTFEAETKCGALCSAQGSGGVAGTGGSPLSCDFAGDCGSCLCASCPGEIADCQGDAGCLAVTWCVQATMCLPFNCYEPDTCGALIDQFGGVNGSAATRALELSTCLLNAGCPCQ